MRIDLKLQLFHSNTFIKNLKLLQFTIISMTLTILAIVYLFFAVFHLLTNLSLIFKKTTVRLFARLVLSWKTSENTFFF